MPDSRTLLLSLVVLVLVSPLAACAAQGTASPAASAPPSSSAPSSQPPSAGSSGTLQFAAVQSLTTQRFSSEPNCARGRWSENPTGINEPHRAKARVIQQYDCYKDDKAYLPTRGQQSMWVEFSTDADAAAYAVSQATLYRSLQDGPRVVVVGIGLEGLDRAAYVDDLKKSCGGCGEQRGPS